MVIGPNGSGKSSILCALCLGLGGSPSVLGRADDVREFIAHDEEEASIEITLAASKIAAVQPKVTIRRTLLRSERGSARGQHGTFYVDGKETPRKAVVKLVEEKYKIAVSNLLSFLPQDKVGSFSSYSPQELLGETMKALNQQQLFDVHQKLCAMEEDVSSETRSVETITERLAALKQETETLQRSKEQMEERKKNVERLQLLEAKRKWVEFDTERQKAVSLKEAKEAAKKVMEEATSNVPALERNIADLEASIDSTQGKIALFEKKNKKITSESKKLRDKADKHAEQVYESTAEIKELAKEQAKKERAADNQAKKFESLKLKFKDMETPDEVDKELAPLQAKQKALNKTVHDQTARYEKLEDDFNDISHQFDRAKRKLKEFMSVKKQKLDRIYKRKTYLRKVVDFVEQNRSKFRRPVYGPIGAELDCSTDNIARYVDQHVSNAVLMAFVVEAKEDFDILYKEVRQKMKIPVNIELVENAADPISREYSPRRMEELKSKYGIDGFLDNFIQAPLPVKKCLCNSSKIHAVLVGSEEVSEIAAGGAIDPLSPFARTFPCFFLSHSCVIARFFQFRFQTAIEIDKPGSDLMNKLSQREGNRGPSAACLCFPSTEGSLYRYTTNVSRYTKKINTNVAQVRNVAAFVSRGLDPAQLRGQKAKVASLEEAYGEKKRSMEELNDMRKETTTLARAKKRDVDELKQKKTAYTRMKQDIDRAEKKLEQMRADAAQDIEKERESKVKTLNKIVNSGLVNIDESSTRWRQLMDNTFIVAGIIIDNEDRIEELDRMTDLCEDEKGKAVQVKEDYERAKEDFAESKKRVKELKKIAEKEAPLENRDGTETPLKKKLCELGLEGLEEIVSAIEDCRQQINTIVDDPHILAEYERKQAEIQTLTKELNNKEEVHDARAAEMYSLERPFLAKLKHYMSIIDQRFSEYMSDVQCAGGVGLSHEPGKKYAEWGIEIRVKYHHKNSLQGEEAAVWQAQARLFGATPAVHGDAAASCH